MTGHMATERRDKEVFQDERHINMLRLLEKIPFSDPLLLEPTYRNFGKQVYDCLHHLEQGTNEANQKSLGFGSSAQLTDPRVKAWQAMSTTSLLVQTPNGILDDKLADYASVDCSDILEVMSVPCSSPNMDGLLAVEYPLSDIHWSDIEEDVPMDIPAKRSLLKDCIPQSFNKVFNSVLYASCEDYQAWITEATTLLKNEGLLREKYQAVAEMQSEDFPTPLSEAECVSLLMTYEFCRMSQSNDASAIIQWIACQLNPRNRTPACKFACLTLLGGISFFVELKYSDGIAKRSDVMSTLLWQAVSVDDLAVAQMVLNWQGDIVNDSDKKGWMPIHLAAERNASTMIHILCLKDAEKEASTQLGNTPLLVAASVGAEKAIGALLAENANPNVANADGWTPVHYAVAVNRANIIELLHQHGAELHTTTLKGSSPLFLAVINDSPEAASCLLTKDAKLANWKSTHSWTALHLAASKKSPSMLQILCGYAGADLNAVNRKRHTPLAIAAMQKCSQAAEVLLKAKANPDVPNTKGWTALHIAAEKDACDLVNLLCEAGANTEFQTVMGNTPLCIAAMHGHKVAVAELLRQNANPNATNRHRWSAIHYTASAENSVRRVKQIGQAGRVDKDLKADDRKTPQMTNKGNATLPLPPQGIPVGCAEALLLGRADPNICGVYGWSPLHLAAEGNNAEMIRLLCSFGADLNAMNQQGYTPLMISVAKDSKEAACALLKNNANPDAQSDLNGWAALHFASQEDNQALCELLCDFNADLNVRTHDNNPPLLIAARKCSKSMTSTLLSRMADVNACDSHGWTALHCAAQENASEIVNLLCTSSANIEARTDKGNTPLAIAAIHNSDLAAEELIKLGADLNAKNSDDWTPLCCAVYKGSFNSSLIECLCSPANMSMQAKQNHLYVNCLLKCGADPHMPGNRGDTPLNVALCSDLMGIAEAIQEYIVKQDSLSSGAHVVDAMLPLRIAAHDGNKKVVKTILEQTENLANVPGEDGYLPIQLAVMRNQPAVVELLSHYCDAKCLTNDKGYTLLHLAAKWNSAQTARLLLSDGHQPDAKDNFGYCPIHVAALNGSTDVIEAFLQHDEGMLFLQGDNGYTVLHCAAEGGHVQVVELICSNNSATTGITVRTNLEEAHRHIVSSCKAANNEVIKTFCKSGKKVSMSDCFSDTRLHYAVLKDDETFVSALLADNPKLVDIAGASGEVPLHWAVKKSSCNIIHILCKANCNVSAGDQHGNTPLHFATAYTRNEVIVQQLLANGAAPEKPNCEGHTPLNFAAAKDTPRCFTAIHDEAEKAYHIDKAPVFYNMRRIREYVEYHQMDKAGRLIRDSITNVQYWKYISDSDAEDKVTLVGIMNEDGGENSCQLLFKAILDKCIFGKKVIRRPAVFEADSEGHLPGTEGYRTEDGSFLCNLVKKPKLLFAVADHPALQAYVTYRWGQIASPFFWRGLLFYLLQLFLLTFALASAARPDLPLNGGYRDPIDVFRGICEVVILIITVVKIGIEIFEIVNNWRAYLLDWLNYVQWPSILLILLIIPLRATAHPGQWVVASFAYSTFGLQAFEFMIISSYIGVYVQTLIIIFWRDILKFLGMFVVILVVLSGSLYLSLRYDADLANSTTAAFLSGEGSFLHETYFTGLRIMIEAGSILDYYSGTGSVFGPLTIILYLLFLFLVAIILLNVLIAQVSVTYTAVESTARASLLFHRSRFITRCEESTVFWFYLWTLRWKKIRSAYCKRTVEELQTNPEDTQRKCCSRLRHKVIRKELYSHDDEDMYWPGQLFHKDESGKYRNSDWRAKFWRKIESARLFVVEYIYPSIVSAYEETAVPKQDKLEGGIDTEDASTTGISSIPSVSGTMEKGMQDIQRLLIDLKEAYETQSIVVRDLQTQIKMIAENQDANVERLQLQREESAQSHESATLTVSESLCQGLMADRQTQRESHFASRQISGFTPP